MPELPEVETVKEVLKKTLIGKEILDIKIYYSPIIKQDLDYFIQNVKNKVITDIKRKGKFLIFCLDDKFLLIHLRMEGKFYIKNKEETKSIHEHIVFVFNDFELRYHDTRKFGTMEVYDSLNNISLNKLGKEPFDISFIELKELLLNKNKPIKELLLDQSIISGIGNIYADEILFYSRIYPLKKGINLTDEEVSLILSGSKKILKEAIALGGTTIRSYTSSLNVTGKYQEKLNVHTKDKCPICGKKIEIIIISGRSTYYCLNCQKE